MDKKEYIYKVECFKAVGYDYITAETFSEAESKSGNLFDSYGLDSAEGDFVRWKIAECDECNELATKMLDDTAYCDKCYEQTMFDYGYGKAINLEREQTNG
jgi:hypothetical protein